MPDALLEVARDTRLEDDLDALGSAFVDAERIGERVGWKIHRLKRSSVTDSDWIRSTANVRSCSVFGDVGDDVEAALREDEPVRLDHVSFSRLLEKE